MNHVTVPAMMTKMNQCHFEMDDALPFVCICTLFSFLCGVGIGGNDLSANFAMVVGSGSLNMKQAIIYCTVFEILGCVFMGAHVSGMIRNGIADPAVYAISPEGTIIGMLSASLAAAMWLFASAIWGLPVSVTHTVVGSILGFAVFSQGNFHYVQYSGIMLVMLSWILAPLLSAFTAAGFFAFLRAKVMGVKRPIKAAEAALPFCLATSLFIELVFVFIGRPPVLDTLATIIPLNTAFFGGLLVIALVCFYAKEYIFPAIVFESMTMESFPWDSATLVTTGQQDSNSPTTDGEGGEADDVAFDLTSGEAPTVMERRKSLRRQSSKNMKGGNTTSAEGTAAGQDTAGSPMGFLASLQGGEGTHLLQRSTSVLRMSALGTDEAKISATRDVRLVPNLTRRESLIRRESMLTKGRLLREKSARDVLARTADDVTQQQLLPAPEDVPAGAATTSPPTVLPRKGTGVYGGEQQAAAATTGPLVAYHEFGDNVDSDSDSSTQRSGGGSQQRGDTGFGQWTASFPSGSAHSPNAGKRRPPPLEMPQTPKPGDTSGKSSATTAPVPLRGASTDNRTSEERAMGVIVYKIGETSEEDEADADGGGEIAGGGSRFNHRAEYLFTILQVVAGAASSFVHGAVAGANATAPFVVLYQSFSQHFLKHDSTLPSGWVSFPASLGIAVGMYSLGTKLMKTVGLELVTVTPLRGWSIQVGGTVITMICTGIGIPVSLSQCQVGAAIGVGIVDGGVQRVAWRVVLKIIAGWLVTLFVASMTTGLFMRILTTFYC